MPHSTKPLITKPPLYYGWYVTGACALIAVITHGVGGFNPGVFLAYFAQEFGWPRSTLSLGPTLSHLWGGMAGIVVGRAVDRHGPRVALLVGALALAAGSLALGLTRHLWQTFPAFLLLSTGFTCLHTVTLGKIIARWFRRDRARAMALATLGVSLGGMLIVPLTAAVLQHWGGTAGGLMLAVLTLVVVVPVTLWVIQDGPEVLGLYVDGGPAPAAEASAMAAADNEDQWTLAEAITMPTFWALAVSLPLGMLAQVGFLTHQVLIYQASLGLLGAAGVVTVTTFTAALSRLLFMLYGNRWTSRRTIGAAYVLEALGLLLLAFCTTTELLLTGAVLLGFSMSLVVVLEPVITSECFGQSAFGRIYGPIYFGTRLAAALGVLLYGVMASATGSYQDVLCLMAGVLLLATCCVQWAIPPVRREAAS